MLASAITISERESDDVKSRGIQMPLFAPETTPGDDVVLSPHEKVYAAAFRKLYYHLYSNSNASRAERIVADLSNLLLCKIAGERNGGQASIDWCSSSLRVE